MTTRSRDHRFRDPDGTRTRDLRRDRALRPISPQRQYHEWSVTSLATYTFDLTTWGWIHLLVGLALVAIGICLLLGQRWALIAGIVVAAISALINFTWLPYSPFWAILVIAVDVLIIWALASARVQTRAATAPQRANTTAVS